MKKFQRVVQIKFESTMREVFIASVEQCKSQLRFAMAEVSSSTGKPLIDTEARGIGSEQVEDPAKQLVKPDILHMSRDAVMQTRFRE